MTEDTNEYERSMGGTDTPELLAPRLLDSLRAAERLDSTFPARVMSAVHADVRRRSSNGTNAASSRRSGWWRRRTLSVTLSPAEGLLIAAGFAGIVVLGSTVRRGEAPPLSVAALPRVVAPETVHVVRFVFTDREATAVALVGDFNAWSKNATPLVEGPRDGTWVATIVLERGRHEYAFVVQRGDRERWAVDPSALPMRDEFGTLSSIVVVDGPRAAGEPASAS